jgi:mannonate dehydratase
MMRSLTDGRRFDLRDAAACSLKRQRWYDMKQTWRWFGPADTISIADVRMAGASGIVSALHHIPNGALWSVDEIKARQELIERPNGQASSLTWDVVESLPISEDIKTQTGDYRAHIETYKQSLENLAACGLSTICYNFMPVLDWTRTQLNARQSNGGTAMHFDLLEFAAFDLFVLKRPNARADYSDAFYQRAKDLADGLDSGARTALANNIVAGLPGATQNGTLEQVRGQLASYDGISGDRLRSNLVDFLTEVVPTAEKLGMRLCCHPDDPPFSLLGLPRVMSNLSDYSYVMDQVDSAASGVTFCTGSLGVDPQFDAVKFVETLGHRIHFVHLRNTKRHEPMDGPRISFHESEHLDGDTDMVGAVHALLDEERKRRSAGRADHEIPMRPDHGHAITSDLDQPMMPGYPLIGRLRGLAELRGVMASYERTMI